MTKSLKEIAEIAGVSQTTVSMVVNGKARQYRIGKATSKRVEEVVNRYGFRPNAQARGLRLQRTQTLGLIVPDVSNPFFSHVASHIENLAREKGYQLFIASSKDDPQIESKLIENFVHRSVDGLIISTVHETKGNAPLKMPTVYIDREIHDENSSMVATDHYQGALDLVTHLTGKGCHNIFYIGGIPSLSSSQQRLWGYQQALVDANIEFDANKVFEGKFDIHTGLKGLNDLIVKNDTIPDAIFTASYHILEGVLKGIKQRPDIDLTKIKIATFDDHPLLDFLPIPISSAKQNYEVLASHALECILDENIAGDKHLIEPILKFR